MLLRSTAADLIVR